MDIALRLKERKLLKSANPLLRITALKKTLRNTLKNVADNEEDSLR